MAYTSYQFEGRVADAVLTPKLKAVTLPAFVNCAALSNSYSPAGRLSDTRFAKLPLVKVMAEAVTALSTSPTTPADGAAPVVTPVIPEDRPVSAVISPLLPEAAAPKEVRAAPALLAPVPPLTTPSIPDTPGVTLALPSKLAAEVKVRLVCIERGVVRVAAEPVILIISVFTPLAAAPRAVRAALAESAPVPPLDTGSIPVTPGLVSAVPSNAAGEVLPKSTLSARAVCTLVAEAASPVALPVPP